MLELTVKTLDSQNHSYSVPDDITVRQFKEKISTSVGVSADKQRLIYCGRVLQDSKKLNEYDVNGKVIHLVQRPPPQAAQPSASTSSTATNAQSASSTSTTTTSGQFGRMPRDGNSFLLGAFTIPSDVTEPNHVQQIVQRIVSGMGELGRNATVMSRTSDDGSSVDVHINLGQVPTQQEGRQMYKQGVHMYKMANQSLERLENFMKNQQNNEAMVGGTENGATAAAETSTAATSGAEATAQEMEISPPQAGPSKVSTEVPVEAEPSVVPEKPASPQPCSSSSPDTEVTSTEVGEGENGEASQARPDTRDPEAESRNTRRARQCRTHLLASLLQDLNRLQVRLQPHLERYQKYLSASERRLSGRELEVAQHTYNSVSEIMHYLSHAYHAVSELVINFVQAPERNLLAYPPNIQAPAAVSIQAQINVSTSSSPNTTQPPSPDHTTATAAAASVTVPSTTASTTTPTAPLSADWSSDAPENPMLQIEVTPASLMDSFSATMMGADTAAPGGAREMGRPGIYVPAPPDFLQSLLQRLGNASAQRATMIVVDANGQSQARGNTATNTTTSTQTRSTARPVQRIPMVLPGFGLSSFDRFLPCSSRHVISRQPMPSAPRDASASSSADGIHTQSAQGANIPADAQLTGVITNLMSALLSQSGTPPTTTGTPSSTETRPSAERTASETQAPPRQSPAQAAGSLSQSTAVIWDTLIRNASTMMSPRSGTRATSQQGESSASSSGQSAAATATPATESDVISNFLQIFNTLPLEDLLGALYGRPEPLNRVQPVLRRFVEQSLLQQREPTEENIRIVVDEVVEMWQDFLLAISQEANVRENIDFVATMNNLMRSRLYDFIQLIITDTDSFGSSIHRLWGTVMHEVIALNLTCFEDGQQSLERIAQTFVRAISQHTNSQLAGTLAQLCTMNIRSMVAFVNLNESQVEHYIARTTASAPSRSEQPVEQTGTDTISSTPDVITIVHEPMEMDTGNEPLLTATEGRPLVGTSSVTSGGAEECNGSSAMWHDVPVEWVPIITKDVQRQRRQATQPPFSDAYADGMPSKRRKIMTSQKVPTGAEARSSLGEILRRSILAAGVQPFTSMEEVTRTLSENDTLQDAYADQLREAMRRRLQGDRDYHPRKFPNSEKFFFSENDDGKK